MISVRRKSFKHPDFYAVQVTLLFVAFSVVVNKRDACLEKCKRFNGTVTVNVCLIRQWDCTLAKWYE